MPNDFITLGIETSCDETALAIYHSERGLLAHQLYSQVAMHNEYGGVVPELASRDHIKKILPLLKATLAAANLPLTAINGIAYTQGPGLAGALLVGASFAKSLALALNIPALGVHHLEAHLLAPMLEPNAPELPFIALLVSGGHTMLVAVRALNRYEILGETLDDAAGEALDKTAKLLGLSYPGGPALEKLAQQGDPASFVLPRPMTDRPGLDFSFSGLKTVAANLLQTAANTDPNLKANLAAAFQLAVVDTLVKKAERALIQTDFKTLVVAGGVSANQLLRQRMQAMVSAKGAEVFYPRLQFCTDNAAMVAYTGALRFQRGEKDADLRIKIKPRWELTLI